MEATHDLPERQPHDIGRIDEVDATPAGVHQLVDHISHTGVPEHEGGETGDGHRRHDGMNRIAAGAGETFGHRHLPQLGDDRLTAESPGGRADGKHRLDHVGVVFGVVLGHHDHGACLPHPNHRQVRDTVGQPRPNDEVAAVKAGPVCSHRLAQLPGLAVGQHHDDVAGTVPAGDGQLLDQLGQPRRRAQDDDVTRFDDGALAALHLLNPLFHAAGDEADQRAGEEDARQRDDQRQGPRAPTRIGGHRAGVERSQQALPEVLDPTGALAVGEGESKNGQQQRTDEDHDGGCGPKPQQHRPDPAGQQVVHPVPEACAKASEPCALEAGAVVSHHWPHFMSWRNLAGDRSLWIE